MGIILSEIAKKLDLKYPVKIINEKTFDNFARISTQIDGAKCIFIANEKYINTIDSSVSMVITNTEIAAQLNSSDVGVCISENPRGLFFELMSEYERELRGNEKPTIMGDNCQISPRSVIADHGVEIGSNVRIGDFVVIHPNTRIGNNVTIQTGAKIAEQDFNVYQFNGLTKQIFHSGNVVIGSNVLISSGVLIGQALYSYGVTSVGDNCFIGAMTCIGHNTEIHNDCEICGNTMIGGYCKIGEKSKIYMSVTIANNTEIGKQTVINVGSNVIRNVEDEKTVFGNPAREILSPK